MAGQTRSRHASDSGHLQLQRARVDGRCRQAVPGLGLTNTIAERIPASTHATLYALDARTGQELWSSGDQIKSWNHWSGLSVANGKVYINTFDGNLYCFGVTP